MFFLFHIYFVQYTIYLLSFSSTMQSAVQGGSGFARNILFRNITLINSYNPIIIDQYYFCRPGESCEKEVGRLKKMVLILDHKDYHPISAIGFSLINIGFDILHLLKKSAVGISGIQFIGFLGTSKSDEAVKLSCSQNLGCTNIFLDHINITAAVSGKVVRSSCINAHGRYNDSIPKVDCLLP